MIDVNKDFNLGQEIYLDTAATSKTPKQVIDVILDYYQNYRATVHRGVYSKAQKATQVYELSRQKIAQFINADREEIVFTRNTTESINLITQTWGRQNIGKSDTIILTVMEHHSNILPWQELCKEKGCNIEYVDLTKDFRLDLNELYKKAIKAKLLSLTHVSNVLGTINPISHIISELRSNNPELIIVVDGAQAVGHIPVNIKDLDCDFYAFSGHKMYGPTGIGVLWARNQLLHKMPPYQTGGEMVKTLDIKHTAYNKIPWKFEAGTPNVSGAIGLGAAVDYINSIGIERIKSHELGITNYVIERLTKLSGIIVFGSKDVNIRIGTFSFLINNKEPVKVAEYLDQKNISIRSGNMCAQPLLKYLGVNALNRMSSGVYNTKEDIAALFENIKNML